MGPLGCFVFFLVFTGISKLLMSPIVNLVYLRQKAEGFFRFQHLHVRSNAEAIAFMDGGHLEGTIADQKLQILIETQQRLILRQFALNMIREAEVSASARVSTCNSADDTILTLQSSNPLYLRLFVFKI